MSFQDTWANAPVNANGGDSAPPPEGDYEIVLIDAGAFTSSSGNEIMKLVVRVVSPLDHNGWEWTELRNFKTPQKAGIAKTTAARLGVLVDQVASLEDLDAALKAHIGEYFEVVVRQNGQYLNTHINGPALAQSDITPPAVAGQRPGGQPHSMADLDEVPF